MPPDPAPGHDRFLFHLEQKSVAGSQAL